MINEFNGGKINMAEFIIGRNGPFLRVQNYSIGDVTLTAIIII